MRLVWIMAAAAAAWGADDPRLTLTLDENGKTLLPAGREGLGVTSPRPDENLIIRVMSPASGTYKLLYRIREGLTTPFMLTGDHAVSEAASRVRGDRSIEFPICLKSPGRGTAPVYTLAYNLLRDDQLLSVGAVLFGARIKVYHYGFRYGNRPQDASLGPLHAGETF